MDYKKEARKYLIFIAGGGIGLILNIAITFLLYNLLGIWFRLAYAAALAANLLFNFFFHMKITFSKSGNEMKRLYRFVPLVLSIAAINYVIVLIFTEIIILKGIMPLDILKTYYNYIVIVAVTATVSVINYLSNKVLVFR